MRDHPFVQFLVARGALKAGAGGDLSAARPGAGADEVASLLIRKGLIGRAEAEVYLDLFRGVSSLAPRPEAPPEELGEPPSPGAPLRFETFQFGGPLEPPDPGAASPEAKVLGSYLLERLLGEGGMGEVYLARDLKLGRPVAVKRLSERDSRDLECRRRFHREAELAAKLNHPNIIKIFEVGNADGRPFMAMELIDGQTFTDVIGSWPRPQLLRALVDVARAVDHASRAGIVHRDLKPANILVTKEGRPVVVDFGLAREIDSRAGLTVTGQVMGTPYYMAPEQAQGARDRIDARTDVYSLGAILYTVLAGVPPYHDLSFPAFLARVQQHDPDPPSRIAKVARDLETVCAKAMAREPQRRYPTARAFADDLERFLSGEPISARPTSRLSRLRMRVRRNPWAWAWMGAAAALILLVALAMLLWQVADTRRQAQQIYREASSSFQAAVHAALMGDPAARRHMEAFEEGLRRAREVDPTFDAGWFERAQFLRLTGDEDGAWANLREGLSRDPDNPLGRVERGLLLADRYGRQAFVAAEIGIPLAVVERLRPELPRLRQEAIAEIRFGEGDVLAADRPWVKLALAKLDWLMGRYDSAEARVGDLDYAAAKLMMGRIAEQRGDCAAAEQHFSDALVTQRNFSEALEARAAVRVWLGVDRWRRGEAEGRAKVEEGLADWESVLDGHPGRGTALLGRARASRRLGDILASQGESPVELYERSISDAQALLGLQAETAPAHMLLGNACLALGDWRAGRGEDPSEAHRRALESFEAARADGGRGMALVARGAWKSSRGVDPTEDFREAIASFDAVLAATPDFAEAHDGRGRAFLGRGLWASIREADPTEDYQQAMEAFAAAWAHGLQDASVQSRLGDAHRALAEWRSGRGQDPTADYARALDAYEAARVRNPASASALCGGGAVRLALARRRSGRGEDPTEDYRCAIEAFDAARARNPALAAAMNDRGVAFLGLGDWRAARGQDPTADYAAAIESFDAVLGEAPADAAAHSNRGLALQGIADWKADLGEDPLGDCQQALESIEAALAANPENALAHNNRGLAWLTIADWRASRGDDPAAEYARAIESFDAALARNPESAPAHNNRGLAWLGLGDWRSARGDDPAEAYRSAAESFDAVLARNPRDAGALSNLALASEGLGDWSAGHGDDPADAYARALASYDAAVAADPGRWAALVNQGGLLMKLARWREALAAFEAALAIRPDDARVRAFAEQCRRVLER